MYKIYIRGCYQGITVISTLNLIIIIYLISRNQKLQNDVNLVNMLSYSLNIYNRRRKRIKIKMQTSISSGIIFRIVKEWDDKINNFKTVLYREKLGLQNEVYLYICI